ncbi:carbohydrate sulfotransferase 9-like [Antedon mediterranea]|uniref:carbohydrate sulfotransferase 9-like n=1 Tax=Antedon mediterranea TaxID=105859 RepID=UPI003AF6747C
MVRRLTLISIVTFIITMSLWYSAHSRARNKVGVNHNVYHAKHGKHKKVKDRKKEMNQKIDKARKKPKHGNRSNGTNEKNTKLLEKLEENCKKSIGHYGLDSVTVGNQAYTGNKLVKGLTLVYNEQPKCIFNLAPFCGEDFWKLLLARTQGLKYKKPTIGRINRALHYMKTLSQSDFSDRLNTSKKVLLIRDPLKRMIAAYRDAFEEKVVRAEIKDVVLNMNSFFKRQPNSTSDITFPEFFRYVASSPSHPTANRLWGPLTNPLMVCDIKWDCIYSIENHYDDFKYIQSGLGFKIPKGVHLAEFKSSLIIPDTEIPKYYERVDKKALSKFYKQFKLDFEIFNYKMATIRSMKNS